MLRMRYAKRCRRLIATLSVVKSPYAGTVRRVNWLVQSPDGSLTAEVTLMVGRQKSGVKTNN